MSERMDIARLKRIAAAALRLRDEPHRVTFNEKGWELEHTLDCRVNGTMLECPVDKAIREWATTTPEDEMGRWDVVLEDGDPCFTRTKPGISDPAADLLAALDGTS